jgi:hypothetical protein
VGTETALAAVGHAIQLSVAPVFLLTAIGAMLGVLTNRLARVVDRARQFQAALASSRDTEAERLRAVLVTLARRAKLISRAITLFTITALFVCGVVVALFVGAFFGLQSAVPVALLFTAAMITFILALLFFLREIFIATASLMIAPTAGN